MPFSSALRTALGHSYLPERFFLRPLRAESEIVGAFSGDVAKKLGFAMFHLASVCWVGMAASMLLLEPAGAGYRQTLQIYAAVFALSGLGNFWAVGKPHFGDVLLLSTSGLILIALNY
jgi:hypothetical protein